MKRTIAKTIQRAWLRYRVSRALQSLNGSAAYFGQPELSLWEWMRGLKRLSKATRDVGVSSAQRTEPSSGLVVDMIASVVDKVTGDVTSWGRYDLFGQQAMFCGSGAPYAMSCYAQNFCGKRAIGSAAAQDVFTGGETLYVEFTTGAQRLSGSRATLLEAKEQFLNRGMVMHKQTKNVTKLSEYQRGRASGPLNFTARDLSLSAPTGSVARKWTDAERAEAGELVRRLASREVSKSSSNE